MQITQRDAANSLQTPTAWTQRDATNTLRTLQQIWMRDTTNTPRQVYSATGGGGGTAQLTPSGVTGYGLSMKTIFVTTEQATVQSPPYGATFNWNFTDVGWSPTTNGPVAAFRNSVGPGESKVTSVTCTVTVGGSSYTTNAIAASVENQG